MEKLNRESEILHNLMERYAQKSTRELRKARKKKKTTVSIKIETNIKEIMEKVERLKSLLEEAKSIIEELASEGIEVNLLGRSDRRVKEDEEA